MQDKAFWDSEGDAWFQRNRESLLDPAKVANDPVLVMIQSAGLQPQKVLEVGCADGWRLAELQARYDCKCCGIDPSANAIEDGHRRHPMLPLFRSTVAAMRFTPAWFDLVIVSFCFHWIDRSHLLRSVSEIDRVLKPSGYLIINDFAPRFPCKRAYKHREGLWTYKQKYWEIFTASGLYSLRALSHYDYDTGSKPTSRWTGSSWSALGRAEAQAVSEGASSENLAACALLQKEEVYRICE